MARYIGPRCRICRRMGAKLFLKASKCLSDKCIFNKRKTPPGVKAKRMSKLTPYALQLKEKQKLRRMYGMLEDQFRHFFAEANRRKGITGDNLLFLLETRLDNVVFRLSFASSRSMARQLVLHGHVTVNGRKVNIPSYITKPGDLVSIREKSRQLKVINDSLGAAESTNIAPWLTLNMDRYEGQIERLPVREEITVPVNEQSVVELYSK